MSAMTSVMERARYWTPGFHMDEVMTGQHEFEPGFGPAGKRPMEATLVDLDTVLARADYLKAFFTALEWGAGSRRFGR